MIRYYITDRKAYASIDALLANIAARINDGIEYIQIREKDLEARAQVELVRNAVQLARGTNTKILANGRADVAIAAGADGIHLPSNSIAPDEFRKLCGRHWTIGVSCHTTSEVIRAQEEGADFVVYSPIFPSAGKGPAIGLEALRDAVQAARLPVFALGGLTEENAPLCMQYGAAGIAGISMFQR